MEKESKRVLQDLCETHENIKREYLNLAKTVNESESDTVFWAVRIDMSEHAEKLGLTEREFYLCIQFLLENKYIDAVRTDYKQMDGDKKIIVLNPMAFKATKSAL